jgi:hypothetical protein
MSNIEIITCLRQLFMAVPDVYRKPGRPTLVFPAFAILSMRLEPQANAPVDTMTLVPLTTKAMVDDGTDPKLTAWQVFIGLFTSIPSLQLLPSGETGPTASAVGPRPAKPTAAAAFGDRNPT